MSDRLEFREKLGGILQKAQGAQNVLSVREVEEYFAEDGLSREQMELVCDYLLSQKSSSQRLCKNREELLLRRQKNRQRSTIQRKKKRYLARYMEENQNNKGRGSWRATKVICSIDRRRCTCKGKTDRAVFGESCGSSERDVSQRSISRRSDPGGKCKPDACTGRIGIRGGSA